MRYITGIAAILFSMSLWSQPVERFELLTDRQVYVAGEHIRFRVFDLKSVTEGGQLSTVYYLELVSPEGNSFARSKALLDSSGTGGGLRIPESLPSGNYFLKGYTRWIRNLGPHSYAYQSVTIINPYDKQILGSSDKKADVAVLEFESRPSSSLEGINCNLPEELPRGEIIPVKLNGPVDQPMISACVSIVKRGLMGRAHRLQSSLPMEKTSKTTYLPETRGVSISGRVTKGEAKSPAPYSIVYISSLGKARDFRCNYTDSAGSFYFALPQTEGEQQLFISSHHKDQDQLEIALDQDFCQEPLQLPYRELTFDSVQSGLIAELSLNAQIATQYEDLSIFDSPASTQSLEASFFYGKAPVHVDFKDFIRLPSLEEYFTEVTPQVSIIREKGKRRFRINGNNPDLRFYDPLIMVDGVAIFDVEAVLEVEPGLVDHLEIVDAPYVIGNVTFGGIINVVTTDGDLGRINLPSSGLLLDYTMRSPRLNEKPVMQPDPRIPDVRNTLLWHASMDMLPGKENELLFAAPSVKGIYEFVLRGFTQDGKYLEYKKDFLVR